MHRLTPIATLRWIATGLAMLGSVAAAVRAQTPVAQPYPDTTTIRDRAVGVELRIPADWKLERMPFAGPDGSEGRLRGISLDGSQILQVLLFSDLKRREDRQPPTFPEWLDHFANRLRAAEEIQTVTTQENKAAERPAAFITAAAQRGADRVHTGFYCVQIESDRVWVLMLTELQPATDDNAAAAAQTPSPVLRQIAATVRFSFDPLQRDALDAALKRGAQYNAELTLQEDARTLRIDTKMRYYLIHEAGQPVGYFTRQFRRDRRGLDERGGNTKSGIRVVEKGWRFAPGGAATQTVVDLFGSRDGETDILDSWRAEFPPESQRYAAIVTTHDECVRQGRQLVTSLVRSTDTGLPDPRPPIGLPNSYLSLAWFRVMPAMLGREPREPLGFSLYDLETRTLLPHTIEPVGLRKLPGGRASSDDKKVGDADASGANEQGGARIADSETTAATSKEDVAACFLIRAGYDPDTAALYVDPRGHMLRYDRGDTRIELSDEATIERLFAARQQACEQRYAEQRRQEGK